MPKAFTQALIHKLWQAWQQSTPDMLRIAEVFQQRGISHFCQDHFAVIDLPSRHSGIPQLKQLFESLGYLERGKDYLADKQNDFLWMAEADCENLPPGEVLPQVVVADFRLDQMPPEIASIISHYANQTSACILPEIHSLIERIHSGDQAASLPCLQKLGKYFAGRDWPLPSLAEFNKVREFNELLAWVLVFGRRPNHFTLSIHLLKQFPDLQSFHRFIEDDVKLALNQEGGAIKGSKEKGLAQGSTAGIIQKVQLADGQIEIPLGFVEFVWRYPVRQENPAKWSDYFTDFIGTQANRVIESLYTD
jgi:hypothetical protein